MFKKIKFQNFKSWRDTGDITLGPITGFFGSNSSGKSSIIQFFLLLKQTMESSDRQRVLNTGDERSYVELGTLYDITHNHIIPSTIYYEIEWDLLEELTIFNPESSQHDILFSQHCEWTEIHPLDTANFR
ncbi:AAA family ATPase [Cylindrospermopsis curvispora]|uniref:AAA family ATPase n=1 Tax=Cylindrospermopsis curvispora TaxID=747548 RepID=UPI001CA63860|nr:AAA family ATPase [Cylindrospermopsis curvispora]